MALSVTIRPAATTGEDANGDDIDIPGEPYELEVVSIYPTTSEEPDDPNRSLVVSGMTILAPEGTRLSPHDEIEIPEYTGRWSIEGEIAIWDARSNPVRRRGFRRGGRGPGLNLGCVQINVRKADG